MSWREVARAARQTGTTNQRLLQTILDGIEWGGAQAGGFLGQAVAGAGIKKAIGVTKVRHKSVRMGVNFTGYNYDNPFTQFGIVTDRTTPRSHMAKSSIGYTSSKAKRSGGRVITKKRATKYGTKKRTSTKKRKRTSVKRGSFKKAKKISKKPTKYVMRHFDDVGSLDRDFCNYFGFQKHGSMDRVWGILGEAVAKQICAKMKWFPRSYDDVPTNLTNFDRITFAYKRVTVPGGEANAVVYDSISFTPSTTYESLAGDVASSMQTHANRTDDTDTVYAYYVNMITIFNSDDPDHNRIILKDVGDSIVEIMCNQVIHIQNMTPNDGSTDPTALDVTGTNPISGKKYEFADKSPKLISEIEERHPLYDEFQRSDGASGTPINRGVQTGFAIPTEDDPIAHPPIPRQLFQNCQKSTSVSLRPGARKTEKTSFKIRHTLSKLVERMYYNQYGKGTFGAFVLFGFERTVRTVGANSNVKIAFDRAVHMGAHCTFKTQKTMLKHYEKSDDITV